MSFCEIASQPVTFAMAHCTAKSAGGRVRAVPRTAYCTTTSTHSCNDLCAGLTIPPNQSPTPYCFDAIHIYGRVMDGVSGGLDADAGMEAYRYTSSGCASLNCGPNFCCCSDTA